MSSRTVCLFVSPEAPDDVMRLAGVCALDLGAKVTVVAVLDSVRCSIAESFAIGQSAIAHVAERRAVLLDDAADQVARQAKKLIGENCEMARIDAFVREPGEAAIAFARSADLCIIGKDSFGSWRNVLETILLHANAPCLVVPTGAAPALFTRPALAWDGSKEAAHAIAGAAPLVEGRWLEVLHVGDGATSCDLSLLRDHLIQHGAGARLHRLARSRNGTATALLAGAYAAGCDLIIMGAYSRSPTAERLLGGVTADVLSASAIPVLLSH